MPKDKRSGSRDYPLYEKMRRKAPRAALFWMAGDRLFHLGLLCTMLGIPLTFVVYTPWGAGDYLVWSGVFLAAAVCLLVLGVYLKRESYKRALKAGIDIINVG
jgi:hypothetical protein